MRNSSQRYLDESTRIDTDTQYIMETEASSCKVVKSAARIKTNPAKMQPRHRFEPVKEKNVIFGFQSVRTVTKKIPLK